MQKQVDESSREKAVLNTWVPWSNLKTGSESMFGMSDGSEFKSWGAVSSAPQ